MYKAFISVLLCLHKSKQLFFRITSLRVTHVSHFKSPKVGLMFIPIFFIQPCGWGSGLQGEQGHDVEDEEEGGGGEGGGEAAHREVEGPGEGCCDTIQC